MKKLIAFPGKYIQGSGVIKEIGYFASILGKKALIIWGARTRIACSSEVVESFEKTNVQYTEVHFNGKCTREEAKRIENFARENNVDVIIGIGGGKAIDTAKGTAGYMHLPLIVVPTIASNDAPTSACTVWYNEQDEFDGYDMWPFNPNVVLVDTKIIVNAPKRTFIAGIGDALATWLEARAAYRSRAVAAAGGIETSAVLALAKLCFDILLEYSNLAIIGIESKAITPAVEKVTEANILLSGIGWESGGITCAHAVANSLPIINETKTLLHGERVCLGIITQLILEEEIETEEVYKIIDFMISVGLPVTFNDFNMQNVSYDRLKEFAKIVACDDSFVHNHNFKVTPQSILDAMITANNFCTKRKTCFEKGIDK